MSASLIVNVHLTGKLKMMLCFESKECMHGCFMSYFDVTAVVYVVNSSFSQLFVMT